MHKTLENIFTTNKQIKVRQKNIYYNYILYIIYKLYVLPKYSYIFSMRSLIKSKSNFNENVKRIVERKMFVENQNARSLTQISYKLLFSIETHMSFIFI